MAHRPTLKKKQKAFKSRHSTKNSIKTANKGRIAGTSQTVKKNELSKLQRKNLANQIKAAKDTGLADKVKIFEGRNGTPRNVVIVPLTADINSVEVVKQLSLKVEASDSGNGVFHVSRFHQNVRFFVPSFGSFFELMDAARAADFVVFVLSATLEIDDYGEQIVRCISSQGVTTSFGLIYDLESVVDTKSKQNTRASLASWMSHFFSDGEKLASLDSCTEVGTLMRMICQKTPKGITWRDERAYLVAQAAQVDSNTIELKGIVRGKTLGPDYLIHVPGLGDLSVNKITEVLRDQIGTVWTSDGPIESTEEEMDQHEPETPEPEPATGIRVDGHHYVNDAIDGDEASGPVTIKRIPQGVSDYQAAWLLEGEDYGFESDAEDGDMLTDEEGELLQKPTGEQEDEEMHWAPEEEERQLQSFRQRSDEDLDYPDEVELDPGESAKSRFQRYRGVRNLGSCEWDPHEYDSRRPEGYNRLLNVRDLQATKNHFYKSISSAGAAPGTVIVLSLNLGAVDIEKARELCQCIDRGVPLVAYGLLTNENKHSLVNVSVIPDSEFETSLPSKEQVIVQYGPRRLVVKPLYSHLRPSNGDNVYKYLRYLHPGRGATASFVAPVLLGKVPVVYYTNTESPQLVGTGTLLDANANRVIIKTAVLTGHPFKIHKKLVTVRYMFFNREDIAWFKEVPLFTKYGRSGFIKEPLGTHGYYKATFDGPLKAQDTIAMALYKRVWPKLEN